MPGGERGERHHLALVVAHVPEVEVLGHHAIRRIGLHVDALHAAAVDEVVDVTTAPGHRQRVVDFGHRHAQGRGLVVVHVQAELRRIFLAVRAHLRQQRALRGQAQQLVARCHQRLVALVLVVLEVQVEAARGAQLGHRRRRQREHHGVLDLAEGAHGAAHHRGDAGLVAGSFVPVLELHEHHAVVLAAAGEAETLHGEGGLDDVGLVIQVVLLDLFHHLLRALLGGTHRRLHDGEGHALVFVGQEGGRHPVEHEQHRQRQQRIEGQEAATATQHGANQTLVALVAGVEAVVEPLEETLLAVVFALLERLEQRRAQRRRQDDRHQHRQAHGGHDRCRELAIDHAGGAGEESHGNEHGRQHEADADQGAGDLVHGFTRGLDRRQAFFAHHALDVFDHHDGVVHQQADRQHHGEHGQHVDREAQRQQDRQRAQQNHRDGDGGDQGGAEVLQEQEDHQEHEDEGLEQDLDHLGDGRAHERRGVERNRHPQSRREAGLHLLDQLGDAFGGGQGVGIGGQRDRDARGRLAVVAADHRITFRTDLDPGDVTKAQRRTVRIGTHDDGAELFRRLQPVLGGDGGVDLLAIDGRRAAELADGHLGVLRLDGRHHVAGCKLVGVELARVEPDAHGVLAAEHLHAAHARHAAQRINDAGRHVIGDVVAVHRTVFGNKGQHLQEAAGGLVH